MKGIGLFQILLLLAWQVNGQSKEKVVDRRWRVGVTYSPAIANRELQFADENGSIADIRNKNEVGKYGYAAGVILQRNIGYRGGLELGLSFTNTGYGTRKTELTWSPVEPSYPSFTKSSFSYQYVSFSGRYQFVLWKGKMAYYIMPGVALDVLVQRKVRVVSTDVDGNQRKLVSSSRSEFNETGLTAIFAIGAKYSLSRRITIALEPIYRRGLISVNPSKQAKEFMYSIGMNTVLAYTLKK